MAWATATNRYPLFSVLRVPRFEPFDFVLVIADEQQWSSAFDRYSSGRKPHVDNRKVPDSGRHRSGERNHRFHPRLS